MYKSFGLIGIQLHEKYKENFDVSSEGASTGIGTLLVYTVTAICVQAQTANIFARLFTFETGRLPLQTEMFHRSCDVSH